MSSGVENCRQAKAAEPETVPDTVTVTAVHPYQVGFDGVVVGPGESLAVPAEVAENWLASGLVLRESPTT